MVTVVVIEFGVMRCQPLRRALWLIHLIWSVYKNSSSCFHAFVCISYLSSLNQVGD
ncbi:acetyltransferase [Vibrio cholerae]|nr:acetyltransferase [Vibrio cholerae]